MDTVACPRCAKICPAEVAFCRRCGTRLPTPAWPAGRRAPARRVIVVPIVALLAATLVTCGILASLTRRSSAPPPLRTFSSITPMATPSIQTGPPPLPPLPKWERRLPADLPPRRDGADFRGDMLVQKHFARQPLSDGIFAGAYLLQADFERADLDGADFRGAEVSQTDFGGADLTGARFDDARVHQSHFVGTDSAAVAGKMRRRNGISEPVPPPRLLARGMEKISFRSARISQTSFDGLSLRGADFSGAEFSDVDFHHADLTDADLRQTRHQFTDFAGATLDGADLRGADLGGARNLTPDQLGVARTDAATRFPRN